MPAQAPHRSGLAQLTHPALQVTDSLSGGRSFQNPISLPHLRLPLLSAGFSLREPWAQCPLPLSPQRFRILSSPSLHADLPLNIQGDRYCPLGHRVLSGKFPCFIATMGFSEFLMSFSFEGLLCSPSGIPLRRFLFRSRSGETLPSSDRGYSGHGFPNRAYFAGTSRLPKFLGNPPVHMPCSTTRWT